MSIPVTTDAPRRPQLFRLDASLAAEGSVSRGVADTFEQTWLAEHPDGVVVRRDLGAAPVPFIDVAASAPASSLPTSEPRISRQPRSSPSS